MVTYTNKMYSVLKLNTHKKIIVIIVDIDINNFLFQRTYNNNNNNIYKTFPNKQHKHILIKLNTLSQTY